MQPFVQRDAVISHKSIWCVEVEIAHVLQNHDISSDASGMDISSDWTRSEIPAITLLLWDVGMFDSDGSSKTLANPPIHSKMDKSKRGRELFDWLIDWLIEFDQGRARTQSPTNKNCAPESPTFGVIAGVNPTVVQWKGLVLGEPPYGSRYPLCQVSMLDFGYSRIFIWLVSDQTWAHLPSLLFEQLCFSSVVLAFSMKLLVCETQVQFTWNFNKVCMWKLLQECMIFAENYDIRC